MGGIVFFFLSISLIDLWTLFLDLLCVYGTFVLMSWISLLALVCPMASITLFLICPSFSKSTILWTWHLFTLTATPLCLPFKFWFLVKLCLACAVEVCYFQALCVWFIASLFRHPLSTALDLVCSLCTSLSHQEFTACTLCEVLDGLEILCSVVVQASPWQGCVCVPGPLVNSWCLLWFLTYILLWRPLPDWSICDPLLHKPAPSLFLSCVLLFVFLFSH